MPRVILHCDMNNCFASVEAIYDPRLRGKPVAVCGRAEDRHGIVLAKSEEAKRCGIKTGDTIWMAKRKCPELLVVEPHYDRYLKYSELARKVYSDYTDQIESFGLDECWLDVTGSRLLFGSGEEIAEKIRKRIKDELGLTISVGVSFNKVFAKLASDMKKPDAVTVITEENFRKKAWPLPASDMLGIGRATIKRLQKMGIKTIGDVACAPAEMLIREFGKNGRNLWAFANGLDISAVTVDGYESPIKSIGHGITCVRDLYTAEEVYRVLLYLSHDVSKRLIDHSLKAAALQVAVKNKDLAVKEFQCPIGFFTDSEKLIADSAFGIFKKNYRSDVPIRALTVRAINLAEKNYPMQTDLFLNHFNIDRHDELERTLYSLRKRYGKNSVTEASLLCDIGVPAGASSVKTLPGRFFAT